MLLQQVRLKKPVDILLYWITERRNILRLKNANAPKPWTDDPILQGYRFCNVNREDDTVTRWITDNWREPNQGHPDLWFAMAVARWINWPDTLASFGLPLPWDPGTVLSKINERRNTGEKVWTGAYMIGTQGNATDKPLFIIENVLQPLWDQRMTLRPHKGDTLMSFAKRIMAIKNQGKFMVGQIVADAKYDQLSPLHDATDWFSFAVSGPGSRRGLNRMMDRSLEQAWKEEEWYHYLQKLGTFINGKLLLLKQDPLHMQDLQNCLCETDKYLRVLHGEGKPRAKYNGGR